MCALVCAVAVKKGIDPLLMSTVLHLTSYSHQQKYVQETETSFVLFYLGVHVLEHGKVWLEG